MIVKLIEQRIEDNSIAQQELYCLNELKNDDLPLNDLLEYHECYKDDDYIIPASILNAKQKSNVFVSATGVVESGFSTMNQNILLKKSPANRLH